MSWVEQINVIFDYVVLNKYPEPCDKNKKANIRFKSEPNIAKSGEINYRKRKNSNVKELLVIRDRESQKRIIETVHNGEERRSSVISRTPWYP